MGKFTCFSEVGAGEAWKDIVYPSMKKAIVHTLLATMEVTETRKVRQLHKRENHAIRFVIHP